MFIHLFYSSFVLNNNLNVCITLLNVLTSLLILYPFLGSHAAALDEDTFALDFQSHVKGVFSGFS